MTKVDSRSASISMRWTDIASALCRFGLGAMWLYSGSLKMMDPMGFRQSVEAYQLFSSDLVGLISTLLPPTEVALGLLLILGLFLRPAAAVTGLIMMGFIVGISSAWVRGLEINCGCFSTDNAAEPSSYGFAIARDCLFLVMAAWTVRRPFDRFALHA